MTNLPVGLRDQVVRSVVRWSLLLAAAGLARHAIAGEVVAGEAKESTQSIRLIVDYGDGVQKHFTKLIWREEMTVLDAMNQARKHRRGIEFEHRGRASTALLTRIDDVRNEGSSGRNWIFRVNDKIGVRSIGISRLEPGDTILWRFETYR